MYDYATRTEQIQIYNELTDINNNIETIGNKIITTLELITFIIVFAVVHNIIKYILWRR